MNFDRLTDDELDGLRRLEKVVSNPHAKWKGKPGHQQRIYELEGAGYRFEIYQRQSNYDLDDHSCGLAVLKPDGQKLTLCRYNGRSHVHHDAVYQCHIHKVTEKAILEGRKPEDYAEITGEYWTAKGALYCLVRDCAVRGLPPQHPDEPDLFTQVETNDA